MKENLTPHISFKERFNKIKSNLSTLGIAALTISSLLLGTPRESIHPRSVSSVQDFDQVVLPINDRSQHLKSESTSIYNIETQAPSFSTKTVNGFVPNDVAFPNWYTRISQTHWADAPWDKIRNGEIITSSRVFTLGVVDVGLVSTSLLTADWQNNPQIQYDIQLSEAFTGTKFPDHTQEILCILGCITNNEVSVPGLIDSLGSHIVIIPINGFEIAGSTDNNPIYSDIIEEADAKYHFSMINLSLSAVTATKNGMNDKAFWEKFHADGNVLVAAAGNEGRTTKILNDAACLPYAVSVGAVNGGTGAWAEMTNYIPPAESPDCHLDILAPGIQILTHLTGDRLVSVNGTSFAAPQVAAIILYTALYCNIPLQDAVQKVLDNAQNITLPEDVRRYSNAQLINWIISCIKGEDYTLKFPLIIK